MDSEFSFVVTVPPDQFYHVRFWLRIDGSCCERLHIKIDSDNLYDFRSTQGWEEVDLGVLNAGTEARIVFYADDYDGTEPDIAYIDDLTISPLVAANDSIPVRWTDFVEDGDNPTEAYQIIPTQSGHDLLRLQHDGRAGHFLTREEWTGTDYQTVAMAPARRAAHWPILLDNLSSTPSAIALWFRPRDMLRTYDYETLSLKNQRTLNNVYPGPRFYPVAIGDFDGNSQLDFLFTDDKCDSTSINCTVGVRAVPSGPTLWTLNGGPGALLSVALGDFTKSPGAELALSYSDGARIASAANGTLLDDFPFGWGYHPIRSIASDSQFNNIAYRSATDELAIYDPRIGSPISSLNVGNTTRAFNTNGSRLVFGDHVNFYLHDLNTQMTEISPHPSNSDLRSIAAGEFSANPGMEFFTMSIPVDGVELALYNETSDVALWTNDTNVTAAAFTLIDIDNDGISEVLTARHDAHFSGIRQIDVRSIADLSVLLSMETPVSPSTRPIDILVGEADQGGANEIFLISHLSGQSHIDVFDLETRDHVRTVISDELLFPPTFLENGQITGANGVRLYTVDATDGSIVWQSTAFSSDIEQIAVGQLDSDPALEWVVLTVGDAIAVVDSQTHLYEWVLSAPGARSIATETHRLYIGYEDRVEQYDTLSESLIREFDFQTVKSDLIWVSHQGSKRYLFAVDALLGSLEAYDIDRNVRVAAEATIGTHLGQKKAPMTEDLHTGMVLVGLSNIGVVRAEVGYPDLPAPGTIFRSGFE